MKLIPDICATNDALPLGARGLWACLLSMGKRQITREMLDQIAQESEWRPALIALVHAGVVLREENRLFLRECYAVTHNVTVIVDGADEGNDSPDACPHKRIIGMYHEILPMLRQVRSWNDARKRLLRARWKEHPDLAWWDGFFRYVGESDFLCGRGDKGFQADLEWLVRPQNFVKVYEGKYHV